ncbi:MAG: polysaccharide deacetylase family protein [Candidatus Bathyarchaeia archaeon]
MAGVRKYPPIIDAAAWNSLVDYLGGESSEARLHPLRRAYPTASAATYVVFAFDDGLVSQYTEAYPRLSARGWRATAFIMPNFIGLSGYMTEAQVKTLRDAGWEIGNHTTNGPTFNTLTRAEVEATVRDAKNWIEQRIEAPCLSFCYPQYVYHDRDGVSAKDLVARYHPYGCQGSGTGWDGYPSQSILRRTITNATYTSVPTWIAEAEAAGKSLILHCHSIGTGGEEITPTNFEAVLSNVAESGHTVLPLRDVAAKYGYPFAMWPGTGHIHSTYDHDSTVTKYLEVVFMAKGDGSFTKTDPGTGYVFLHGALTHPLPFDLARVKQVRVVVTAQGNEAGNGKGVAIWNQTDGVMLCEATWNGSARQDGLAGPWTEVNLTAQKSLLPYVKGSSASEDISVYRIVMQAKLA